MAIDDVSTKCCVDCNTHKPLDQFSRDRSKKGGFKKRCRVCHAAATLIWRDANIDAVNARKRAWRTANLAKCKQWELRYASLHRSEANARARAWYVANQAKHAAYGKQWRVLNPDRYHESLRRYYQQSGAAKGRAKRSAMIAGLLRLQNGKCAYCRILLKKAGIHVDHIRPISLGGRNGSKNLQLTCPACNLRKHAKDPLDFARQIGRLL